MRCTLGPHRLLARLLSPARPFLLPFWVPASLARAGDRLAADCLRLRPEPPFSQTRGCLGPAMASGLEHNSHAITLSQLSRVVAPRIKAYAEQRSGTEGLMCHGAGMRSFDSQSERSYCPLLSRRLPTRGYSSLQS